MEVQTENKNDKFDLNDLRGAAANADTPKNGGEMDDDLNALAELVPDLKNRKTSLEHSGGVAMEDQNSPEGQELKHVDSTVAAKMTAKCYQISRSTLS